MKQGILVVYDDEPTHLKQIEREVRQYFTVKTAGTREEMMRTLSGLPQITVALLDKSCIIKGFGSYYEDGDDYEDIDDDLLQQLRDKGARIGLVSAEVESRDQRLADRLGVLIGNKYEVNYGLFALGVLHGEETYKKPTGERI